MVRKINLIKLLLLLSVFGASASHASEHAQEAEFLMRSYLEKNNFVDSLHNPVDGRALGLVRSLSSKFSTHSKPEIKGDIEIDSLSGDLRLKLSTQKDLLYIQKSVQVDAQISVDSGRLQIYSPVEIDFWSMAALFVDRPEKRKENGKDWKIKGYIVHSISAGEPYSAKVNLLAMANDYMMLIRSTDGESRNIRIQLK